MDLGPEAGLPVTTQVTVCIYPPPDRPERWGRDLPFRVFCPLTLDMDM